MVKLFTKQKFTFYNGEDNLKYKKEIELVPVCVSDTAIKKLRPLSFYSNNLSKFSVDYHEILNPVQCR